MEYHYLLAGLDELQEGQKSRLAQDKLLELLHEQMSASDFKLIELLQKRYDDPSVVALMEEDTVKDRFQEYALSKEDFQTQLLYEEGMKCSNKFVRRWFEFNLNLNNVLAAAVCQKHDYETEKVIVGDNEVAQLLRKGGVHKNQNLAAVLPELKEMIAISEISNLLDREKHIDALRWQWIDEATLFCYFQIDNVLAYYLKSQILHRWDDLTKQQGEQVFRRLLQEMKKDVKF